MLPLPDGPEMSVMLSDPVQLTAWSEFYSSSFYVSECAGRGANGEVWRGIMLEGSSNTRVVLKRIYASKGAAVVASSMRELYFGSMLSTSSHMARFMTHFVEGKDLWLVFHDEGISLYQAVFHPVVVGEHSVMARSAFWGELRANPLILISIMRQVFEALAELHALQITHRDVKLENILIDPVSLKVRLADFGSAIPNDESLALTLFPPTGPSLDEETHRYAPPEAQNGSFHRNPSFDMWCAGVVVLELFLGTVDLGIDERDGICIHDRVCVVTKLEARIKARDPLGVGVSDPDLLDLIARLLAFDPVARISASEALNHPVFHPIDQVLAVAVVVSSHAFQGHRSQMEDRVVTRSENGFALACVMDGHNGDAVAEFLSRRIPELVFASTAENPEHRLIDAVASATTQIDQLGDSIDSMTGSTLCCVLVDKEGRCTVANIGDSRALLIEPVHVSEWVPAVGGRVNFGTGRSGTITELRNGIPIIAPDDETNKRVVGKRISPIGSPVKVTQITRDHKPDDPKELSYIESVGGSVSMSGETARVNGILAISRSVGVKALQTAVRAEPEIFTFTLRVPSTLVVATDGVFDVLSNQRVGELSDAKQIVQYAFDNGARDNLAVALIDMQSSPVDLRDEL